MPFDYSTPMGSPCLSPTVFLDSDNPSVQRFASDAIGDAASPKERAIRLFYAVREQIPYDPYAAVLEADAMRASAVIAKGKGFCVAKAILLAAVLRAIGIPARLGFADVTNHLATRRLLELLRTDVFVFHGYAEVLLDDRWVKATPAFHSRLCARFGVPALDFDGEHDAVLQPFDGRGRPFMQYLRSHGSFNDFPHEAMLQAWRKTYPHLFEMAQPTGDFEAEA